MTAENIVPSLDEASPHHPHRDQERGGNHADTRPPRTVFRYAPHDATAECGRGDVAGPCPANGTFQRDHSAGVLGAGRTDIEVPADLQLAFRGQFTVDQRMQFLEGWTVDHWDVLAGRCSCA